MSSEDFAYTGCDNLEVMAEAVNYNRFLVDSVLRQVPGPGARVLDFGAGSGTYASMLAERDVRPEVLEPDPALQDALAQMGHQVVDPAELDGEADVYDLIYSLNVLEHIKNDQQAVDDMARVLRPGGRLVVYVPAMEVLYTAMDAKVQHYRRYRRRQLERIIRNAGLQVIHSSYCDPLGFLATLVYRWFGRDDGTIAPLALRIYDRVAFPVSRALQAVCGRVVGKNVLVVATKTHESQPAFTTR